MGIFDGPLAGVRAFLERQLSGGQAAVLAPRAPPAPAADGPQVVLRQQAALELGSPDQPSLSLLLWGDPGQLSDGRMTLAGPDLDALPSGGSPFGRVLLVGCEVPATVALERHARLRDALYGARLQGVMTRVLPSRHRVWVRVSRTALERGLRARDLGSAALSAVRSLPFVEAAEVLLVTAGQPLRALQSAAGQALLVLEALRQMERRPQMTCEDCPSSQICALLDELRAVHETREAATP
jgi:CO dehydrogenase/acetyl-CoA synthase beta subunit